MALTATATTKTRISVQTVLCMSHPNVIYLPPTKSNIYYTVLKKPEKIVDVLQKIAFDLSRIGKEYQKTIVYCRYYKEVTEMYEVFVKLLKEKFTNPPGAPNLSKYRLVDMYTKCTENSVKEKIVTSFVDSNSNLRVVIATTAFGMGLDCPSVRHVIHWGPADDIDSYVQQTVEMVNFQLQLCIISQVTKCTPLTTLWNTVLILIFVEDILYFHTMTTKTSNKTRTLIACVVMYVN